MTGTRSRLAGSGSKNQVQPAMWFAATTTGSVAAILPPERIGLPPLSVGRNGRYPPDHLDAVHRNCFEGAYGESGTPQDVGGCGGDIGTIVGNDTGTVVDRRYETVGGEHGVRYGMGDLDAHANAQVANAVDGDPVRAVGADRSQPFYIGAPALEFGVKEIDHRAPHSALRVDTRAVALHSQAGVRLHDYRVLQPPHAGDRCVVVSWVVIDDEVVAYLQIGLAHLQVLEMRRLCLTGQEALSIPERDVDTQPTCRFRGHLGV